MTITQTTAPSLLPVSLQDVKANSRIDTDLEDEVIISFIRAAVARCERETGMAFAAQSWEYTTDAFPDGEIVIPMGPIGETVVVTYIDDDGDTVTVDAADYYVDTYSADGRIVPVDSWPTAAERPSAVKVAFTVGAASCPQDVRQAIILMASHWINHRETADEKALVEIPYGAGMLLSLHRRMFV